MNQLICLSLRVLPLILLSFSRSFAQSFPMAVATAGSSSATALAVQGTKNGLAISSSDYNNAPFINWSRYNTGVSYSPNQLSGVKSIQLVLSTAGTFSLVDNMVQVLSLPYPNPGLFIIPFVPTSIMFSDGAVGQLWMLR